ncbi:hypothetical protein AF332_00415 [Sporosarcina globispora]|uniref:Uncharacterized protein n=1 Tax=Sporosarcina globispora TaxID=1459 RepID=A0A0M0G7K1_SPOGL|nr:hypothetical protein AF332_00415 [Sporosarcina globispora]
MFIGCLRNNGYEVGEVLYIINPSNRFDNLYSFRMFKSRRDITSNNFTPIDDLDNGLVRKISMEPHKIEARSETSFEDRKEK